MPPRPSISKLHEYSRDVHERSEEILRITRNRYLTADACVLVNELAEGLVRAANRLLDESCDPRLDYVPKE